MSESTFEENLRIAQDEAKWLTLKEIVKIYKSNPTAADVSSLLTRTPMDYTETEQKAARFRWLTAEEPATHCHEMTDSCQATCLFAYDTHDRPMQYEYGCSPVPANTQQEAVFTEVGVEVVSPEHNWKQVLLPGHQGDTFSAGVVRFYRLAPGVSRALVGRIPILKVGGNPYRNVMATLNSSMYGKLARNETLHETGVIPKSAPPIPPSVPVSRLERKCARCGIVWRKSMKVCGGCQKAQYCSKACQVDHWKNGGHKEECKKMTSKSK